VHLALKYTKSGNKERPKKISGKKLIEVTKHAYFYADFKSVEKVAGKSTQKSYCA
jgi:hypothetical protein